MEEQREVKGRSHVTGKEFNLGGIYQTRSIAEIIKKNPEANEETLHALTRYLMGDWGDLPESDKQMNEDAIANEDDRLLASYHLSYGKIYIITEWDRSYTTIMLASDY